MLTVLVFLKQKNAAHITLKWLGILIVRMHCNECLRRVAIYHVGVEKVSQPEMF